MSIFYTKKSYSPTKSINQDLFLVCNDVIKYLNNDVSDPILKCHCRAQVDKPINARVIAVQSSDNLYTFILRLPCWWEKECPPAHFPI